MTRYWVSWWSGNYADEGCTAPPFKFWTSGQRDRPNHGLNARCAQISTIAEQHVQFKLNPTTLAVRRALAELPYEAKIPNDAPKTERTEAMKAKHRKKHVFWNREHITRLADAMFPKMLGVVQFPIAKDDRVGIIKIADAAQLECFSAEERGVITTERREKLIVALNRRFWKHSAKVLQPVAPTAAEPVTVTSAAKREFAEKMADAAFKSLANDPEVIELANKLLAKRIAESLK